MLPQDIHMHQTEYGRYPFKVKKVGDSEPSLAMTAVNDLSLRADMYENTALLAERLAPHFTPCLEYPVTLDLRIHIFVLLVVNEEESDSLVTASGIFSHRHRHAMFEEVSRLPRYACSEVFPPAFDLQV